MLMCIISITSYAQQRLVQGKVTDQMGSLLVGVNVYQKDNFSNGVITGPNGDYSIKIDKGKTIVFSFIGFEKQEVVIGDQTNLDIVLHDNAFDLEEVVAVGYGVQKKVSVTGAVTSIKNEELTRVPSGNVTKALVGKMPGLLTVERSGQPGYDGAELSIRGKSTFGNNSPLVIVDGVERSFSQLDPNEIESISILKDASTAAIYGVRASNGVILVTTKQGKDGKMSVTINHSYSVQTPAVKPDYLNAYEYASLINVACENQGVSKRFSDDEVEKYKKGDGYYYKSTDWYDKVFDLYAPMKQTNLTIRGGTEKSKYFFSLGYLDQKGMYDNAWHKRYNFRSNFETVITDRLTMHVNLGGRLQKRSDAISSANDVFYHTIRSLPTYRAYHPDGSLNFNGIAGTPIGVANELGTNRRNNDVFQSTLKIEYEIPKVEGLKATVLGSFDKHWDFNKRWKTPYTFYNYNKETKELEKMQGGSDRELYQRYSTSNKETFQFHLNYNKAFGSHSLDALLLFEQTLNEGNHFDAKRIGFLTSAIPELFAGNEDKQTNGGSRWESARQGYAARINYDYAGKYLVKASFRYDGSYIFEKDQRWGFFPSFSVGYRISEEDFFKEKLPFVDNLKLRASWGQYGNDRIKAFQYLSAYGYSRGFVNQGSYQKGITASVMPNHDVTWETASSTNIGADAMMWQGLLGMQIDLYKKRTEDILYARNASIPALLGASLPDENLAIVENKGLDLELTHQHSIGQVEYNVGGTFTYAKSEVIFFDEAEDINPLMKKTGLPFDQRFGYKSLGLFQSQKEIKGWADQDLNKNKSIKPGDIKYADLNKDGKITSEDRTHIGKGGFPEIVFGFKLGAKYKNFDFNAGFQGATNYTVYMSTEAALSFFQSGNSPKHIKDSWSETNKNARYPRLLLGQSTNNRRYSNFWMEDVTYLRLKNLSIGYTLNKELLNKVGIENCRFYVSGQNLLTWTNVNTFDPEISSGRGSSYPVAKVYNIGLSVNF